MRTGLLGLTLVVAFAAVAGPSAARESAVSVYRVDHVVDGDTITLRNGQRVRLVQIDTPEVYFGVECYGRAASRTTEGLLPVGSRVRLFRERATDSVDQYGRLLRYVVRVDGALNVNRLVAVGAAAPYFYLGRRGRFAARLEFLARRARARHLGLWGACPRTPYDPYRGVQTRGETRHSSVLGD